MTSHPRQTDPTTGEETSGHSLEGLLVVSVAAAVAVDLVTVVVVVDLVTVVEVVFHEVELTMTQHGLVVEEEVWGLQHLEEMALVAAHLEMMTVLHGPETHSARRFQTAQTGAVLAHLVRMRTVHGPVGHAHPNPAARAVADANSTTAVQMKRRCGHEAQASSLLHPPAVAVAVMGQCGPEALPNSHLHPRLAAMMQQCGRVALVSSHLRLPVVHIRKRMMSAHGHVRSLEIGLCP